MHILQTYSPVVCQERGREREREGDDLGTFGQSNGSTLESVSALLIHAMRAKVASLSKITN